MIAKIQRRRPSVARIHLVALPHTLITRDYDWCAYTGKLRRFTGMLAKGGHTAIMYGPDVADIGDTELVPVVGPADRLTWFGSPEWDATQVFTQWNADAPCWSLMNARAAAQIADRWQPGDILGLIAGACQQGVVDQLRTHGVTPLVWEWGIGYSGVLDGSHKTFESYAWAHHVAGLRHSDDIAYFDAVIPNCFDVEDFTPSFTSGEYLLFMGRPTPRKGLPIIQEIAKRVDIPLVLAGQPGADIPGAKHVGIVTGRAKAELLAGAYAALVPTTYLEPFGGVAVEAMLSGTPVITTDWGAFTETVDHGRSGFRARTLAQFLDAVDAVADLDRQAVWSHAMSRYTTSHGAILYDRHLQSLTSLHDGGWYSLPS